MDIDSERTTGLDIIQIGTMNISLEDKAKGYVRHAFGEVLQAKGRSE